MKNRSYWILFLFLLFNQVIAQDKDLTPALNKQIVSYVESVINTKVDRGECWDLANKALTNANASWEFPTKFGKLVNPAKDTIFPGDIMQFSNVKLKNNKGETWTFPKHTAIVYKVIAKGVYKIAEQNVNGNKKVQIDDFAIQDLISGKVLFYRPQAK
jgi:hypothetical protein